MKSFGPYVIEHQIGAGGMARVYRVRRPGRSEPYALKVMLDSVATDRSAREDFAHEGRLAARIRHPNVVGTHEVLTVDAHLGLVMELVDGATLDRVVRHPSGSPVPVGVATSVILDVLAGLQAAHDLRDEHGVSLGVVHRDVSPQNVLLARDGTAKLADFGIALAASKTTATKTGFVKGKAAYMAPEQIRGDALDARVDVWAVGVLAWELLAGRPLFRAENDVATALRVLESPIPRVAELRPEVSTELAAAVHAALVRDVAARAPGIAALRERFLAAASGAGAAPDRLATSALVHAAMDDDPTVDAATRPMRASDVASPAPAVPSRTGRRRSLLVLASLAGTLLLVALGVARRNAGPPMPASEATVTASPLPADASPGIPVASVPPPMPVASSTAAPLREDAITLLSNAPMRRVKVDGRSFEVEGVRYELLVEARVDGRPHEVVAFGPRGERTPLVRVTGSGNAQVRFASRPSPSAIPALITNGVYD